MWIRTLDDKLVNLAVCEAVDIMETFADEGVAERVRQAQDRGEPTPDDVTPDAFEIVAFMSSGWSSLLYAAEDFESVERAYGYLARMLASSRTDVMPSQIVTLADLMDGGTVRGPN